MTSAEAPSATDDTPPIPPRYWWLKRILLAVGVLILALVALRWWWGYEAERRLQANIDEYRAAGQPVTIEDFQFPPVPDEDNAAHFLTSAHSTLARPSLQDAVAEDLYSYPDGLSEHADAAGRWVAANAETLRLVREARGKDNADWGVRIKSPAINTVLPQLSGQRALARFLCTTALFQHHAGDDAAAVETLRDTLAQGQMFGEMRAFLVGHLVAITIDALAVDALESIAPTLLVAAQHPPDRPEVTPATRAQIHALIADLLDEETLRENWRWAIYGERLSVLDSVKLATTTPGAVMTVGGGGLPPQPLARFLEPMFKLDAVFMMKFCAAYAEAGLSTDYHQAKHTASGFPRFESNIERTAHLLSWNLLPSLDVSIRFHFQALAARRMAATAVAIRLYELDHGGRPISLEELVPDYLSSVPADPFAADGRSLGYRPDAPKPVLYSVGVDGKDDGGEYEVIATGLVTSDALDLVFFLDGDRPWPIPASLATQPAGPEAVEDEGNEVGNGGQPE